MAKRFQFIGYVSAMLCGFTSLLSLFSLLDGSVRARAPKDADMIHSDWKAVGDDIYQAMMKMDGANGR